MNEEVIERMPLIGDKAPGVKAVTTQGNLFSKANAQAFSRRLQVNKLLYYCIIILIFIVY